MAISDIIWISANVFFKFDRVILPTKGRADRMRIDFYYWGCQCPLNLEMIGLLQQYRDVFTVSLHDVTDDFALAQQQKMYFPTLTVVDCQDRFFSPLKKAWLDQLAEGKRPTERPWQIELAVEPYQAEITALTAVNLEIACRCTGKDCAANCEGKRFFLLRQKQPIYGFIHTEHGLLLGGAEYLPSLQVPYAIPHRSDTAFLTCSYAASEKFDYKTAPLRALETYLCAEFRQIIAITDETGVFPNGTLDFFLANGYTDQGVIAEESGYCKLHLVQKQLQQAAGSK